jgi:putative transposase
LTLPTTPGGTALVQPNHGVKINYIYYWSDTFRNPEVERTRVSVRYDPFDAGVAYAHVNGRWVRCVSEHYAAFKGRSEREVKLASEALHKKNQLHSQQFNLTARKLANFIVSVEAEEVLLEQQLRDTSNRSVLATLGSNPPDSDHDSARMSLASTPTRDVPPQPESMSAGNPLNDYDHLEVYGEY